MNKTAKDFPIKDKYNFDDLCAVMKNLRGEGGCPWDREQTHESIRKNFIEETYEVAEAIDTKDKKLLCEELGDVLLQVVFHTEMETEVGGFDIGDVTTGIVKKLIYRHPHIFGDVSAETTDTVLENWDAEYIIEKAVEKDDFETTFKLGVLNCIECGACSYSCPAKRPLVQAMRLAKKEIKTRGIK